MTAKVIRIPEPETEMPSEPEAPLAGWDPYEVWRTRVLLPRLEETESEAPRAERDKVKRSIFKRLRRSKKD